VPSVPSPPLTRRCVPRMQALVKSGCCLGGEVKITDGGANFFLPCCQMVQLLDLSLMTLKVESPHMSGHFGGPGGDDICVYTKDGVPVRVNSVAQVRIGPPPELDGGSGDEKERYLRSAASIFGDLSREACRAVITQTLEGHQRSMIGNMYAKELLMDRKAFAQEVNRSATVDLIGMGVWVTSFVIQDVKDDNEYISSLGKAEVAKKKEQARIGQAEMTRDAAIKEAEQERNSETKMFENKISEEEAKKDRLLKQAGIDFQTNQRTAVVRQPVKSASITPVSTSTDVAHSFALPPPPPPPPPPPLSFFLNRARAGWCVLC
jgi:flotillin